MENLESQNEERNEVRFAAFSSTKNPYYLQFHRADLGYFKIFSENLSLGIALKDISSGVINQESTGTLGIQ